MSKVSAAEGRHGPGGDRESAPSEDPGGARRAGRGGEGGAARAQRRRRARRRARADGARGRRGRRPEGQARPRIASAVRHGHEDGSMTLGGRRVPVRAAAGAQRRRRARAAGRDLRVLRRPRPADAGGDGADARRRLDAHASRGSASRSAARSRPRARSTSKSSVSETFVERTRSALGELMSRRLDDVRLAVMMLDGLEIAGRTHVVALGITTEGVKIPLGLWEG